MGGGTVETVLVLPLMFTVVLFLAQAAVYLHANHIAQEAAVQALAATRVQHGTEQAGSLEGDRILSQLGPGPLRGAQIDVTRGALTAEVQVTGTAGSVLPFLRMPVRAQSSGPVERVTDIGGGAR
ncbi:TadE family protein [Streptomyces sp. SDT5-1]|uniref:TadE family protein n=1 Tax=Streptomyces sp. SDT5-1 TaxID=3406418 RepID=UPI003FD09D60